MKRSTATTALVALGAGAGVFLALRRLAMASSASASSATRVLYLRPAAAAFPGLDPGCVVVVPPRCNPANGRAWVYYHGWNNCVSRVVASEDGHCHAGGPRRNHSALAVQLEASGTDAVLVVPELRPEVESGDPGALGRSGGLAALLAEVLPQVGAPPVPRWLGVMSHSGGYQAARAALVLGGLPVAEASFLDSLYGYTSDVVRWARGTPGSLLSVIYTGGDTETQALSLARSLGVNGSGSADGDGPPPARWWVGKTRQSHVALTRTFPRRVWSRG